jgi:hypothetical protein
MMRKSFLAVAAMIIINSLSFAQTPANDFRGFTWGNLLSQVKTGEKSKFVSQDKDDLLTYEDQLAGSDVVVNYQFNDNDKLVSGTYTFTKKYSNPQLYIQDFAKFKNLLNSKYGAARLNKEEWSANTTPNEKENYGQAISDGNLSLYSVWTTGRSEIKIILNTKNNVPLLQIHYTCKSLDELENKEELKKALLKL